MHANGLEDADGIDRKQECHVCHSNTTLETGPQMARSKYTTAPTFVFSISSDIVVLLSLIGISQTLGRFQQKDGLPSVNVQPGDLEKDCFKRRGVAPGDPQNLPNLNLRLAREFIELAEGRLHTTRVG